MKKTDAKNPETKTAPRVVAMAAPPDGWRAAFEDNNVVFVLPVIAWVVVYDAEYDRHATRGLVLKKDRKSFETAETMEGFAGYICPGVSTEIWAKGRR